MMPRPRSAPAARNAASGRRTPSDGELVARCMEGDQAAWALLVERYRRLVHSVPSRMGLAPQDAEDVFQQTFIALSENLPYLRDRERVGPWLAVTARRAALQLVRRPSHGEEQLPEVVDARAIDPLPDAELLRLERQNLVRLALDGLSRRCRELLTALFYEDPSPSYQELAERLGLPVGSLGPNRIRCLDRLRKALQGTDAGAVYFPEGPAHPVHEDRGPK